MSHCKQTSLFAGTRAIMSTLVLLCGACATTTATAPTQKAQPQAALTPLKGEHQEVVDRLTDQANELCRVSGQQAKVLQVGTTDLSKDPESRHIVYECVEDKGTEADEADASPEP